MKNITIKFIDYAMGNISVTIYDGENIIYEGYTCNNKINLNLKECKAYRIVASSYYGLLNSSFYVTSDNIYYFSINPVINNDSITFYLTDYYYDNLPIERGEIILWQK